MKIIIDTNIYLNFYRLKNDQSLKLVDQLIKLIKDKKIELILTQQIKNEFYRDKNVVFKEYLDNLNNSLGKDLRVPKFIELNKKSQDFTKLLDKTRKALIEFKKEYQNRVLNPKSQINKKIEALFKLSNIKEETKEILEIAYFRTLRGNPPRKGNHSFGDAIIWETILKHFNEDDLKIISGDGDFESDSGNGEINEFLFDEFYSVNKKNIQLYKNLSEFINSVTKKQTITKKIISEEKKVNNISQIRNIISFPEFENNSIVLSGQSMVTNQFTNNSSILKQDAYSWLSPTTVTVRKTCQICGKTYNDKSLVFSMTNICPDCDTGIGGYYKKVFKIGI